LASSSNRHSLADSLLCLLWKILGP